MPWELILNIGAAKMDGKTIIDHQNHSPALYVSRKRDNYWLIVSLINVKIFQRKNIA